MSKKNIQDQLLTDLKNRGPIDIQEIIYQKTIPHLFDNLYFKYFKECPHIQIFFYELNMKNVYQFKNDKDEHNAKNIYTGNTTMPVLSITVTKNETIFSFQIQQSKYPQKSKNFKRYYSDTFLDKSLQTIDIVYNHETSKLTLQPMFIKQNYRKKSHPFIPFIFAMVSMGIENSIYFNQLGDLLSNSKNVRTLKLCQNKWKASEKHILSDDDIKKITIPREKISNDILNDNMNSNKWVYDFSFSTVTVEAFKKDLLHFFVICQCRKMFPHLSISQLKLN